MDTKKVSPYTGFLFARPSFIEGVGRIVDFFGVLQKYNTSSTSTLADTRAIYADWRAVGDDMKAVLRKNSGTSRASRNGTSTPSMETHKHSKKRYERKPVTRQA